MKLTVEEVDMDRFLWSLDDEEGRGREPGLHLSDVLDSLEAKLGIGKDFSADLPGTWDHYRAMGFLFERAMFQTLPDRDRITRPGQVQRDGIWMTVDGMMDEGTPQAQLVELKFTYRSSVQLSDFEGNFRRFIWQVKSYCGAMGTRRALLYIAFANGDYGKDGMRGPKLNTVVRMRFTPSELEKHWKMITNHKTYMEREHEQRNAQGN